MDRHKLLEQKRQRLAELRLRRLAASEQPSGIEVGTEPVIILETDVSNATEALQKQPLVDVGVQVKHNKPSTVDNNKVIKEVTKFDKAVQTVKREVIVEEEKQEDIKEEVVDVVKETNFNENHLNKLLKEAIVFLNEIMAHVTVKSSSQVQFVSSSKDDLIQMVNEIDSDNGVPYLIDVSPQPNEFVVGFNRGVAQELAGFAIIYKVKNGKVIPVHFLGCESPISVIKFHQSTNKKVIGGLQNGRVIVWEIDENIYNNAVLLPILMSPVDYTNSSFHKSAITSILQIPSETNTFISTCADGMLNTWSVNFLEHPRSATIVIPNDVEDTDSTGILARRTKSIRHALILGTGDELLRESKFLNSMIIGTQSGTIHQLINDKKLGYVNSTINTKIIGSLVDIGYKDDLPIIAATCFDSNIYIYNSHKEILQLFTNYLVLGLFKRPNHHFQFITYGLYNELSDNLTTAIDFWNLETNIRSPIYSIKINSSEHPILGQFDIIGNTFYIGFSDGKLSVFDIIREMMSSMETHNEDSINDII